MFTETVPGPHGAMITGLVTDVTGSGIIVEIRSHGVTYERSLLSGIFYPKY